MQKGIIALLTVMLVIIVVFTSLGIAYSKNDFVSTMVKVEQTAGDFSVKTLETYNAARSAWSEISKLIDFSSLGARIENIRKFFVETFGGIRNRFAYFNEYGFNLFSSSWWNKYNFFYKMRKSAAIINPDGSYNWTIFESLYLGSKNGVLPDELKYIEYNYNAYKQKCYQNLLKSDNYSLLFVSYTSAESKSLQTNYKKICDSKVPFICVKIPAVTSLVYNPDDFLGVFSVRDFITDMLTDYEYPVLSSFRVDVPDLSLTNVKPQFVRFSEISDVGSMINDSTSCRFRFDISHLLNTLHNILGDEVFETVDGSAMSTPLLGISFGFKDLQETSHKIAYFEAGKIYLDYIEQNDLVGFAVPDFGYAVPTANIFNSTILGYDDKDVIGSMLN